MNQTSNEIPPIMIKVVITYASTIFCSRSLITLEGLSHYIVSQYIMLP